MTHKQLMESYYAVISNIDSKYYELLNLLGDIEIIFDDENYKLVDSYSDFEAGTEEEKIAKITSEGLYDEYDSEIDFRYFTPDSKLDVIYEIEQFLTTLTK